MAGSFRYGASYGGENSANAFNPSAFAGVRDRYEKDKLQKSNNNALNAMATMQQPEYQSAMQDPSNRNQFMQDQGLTPVQQQAVETQRQAPMKQALSNAAIMAVTAPDEEFESTKVALFKSAVAQGMDLAHLGVASEEDAKKLTRADMAKWIVDPKMIEELGKKRLDLLKKQ